MLATLFGSRLRARLLSWLVLHSQERFYVRQLESLLGEDSSNLSRELARLARLGILIAETEGRQKYFRIDPEGSIYDELRGLVLKTSGLAGLLRDALALLGEGVTAAFLYGSFAAGEEGLASDVDLLVVGRASFAEISDAVAAVEDRVGREVNPVVVPPEELQEKLAHQHPFLTAVMKGPKLFVIGGEDELERLVQGRLAEGA